MKVQFICLANSRRESGRCVAGIRTDESGWFRPISISGPLTAREYLLEDGSVPEILNTIEVDVVGSKPESYQPENWILGNTTWKLVNKIDPSNAYALLKYFINSETDLFGNQSDRVALTAMKDNPIQASLALVVPKGVSWFITKSIHGKRQTRALFSLQRTAYNLSITDPIWEKRLENLEIGLHPREAAEIGADMILLFTISLGGPFNGECYKLVAGILELPEKYVYMIDLLTRLKINFQDMRQKGGALWLIGGAELSALISDLNAKGISFRYSPNGGKASGYRPGWYFKD